MDFTDRSDINKGTVVPERFDEIDVLDHIAEDLNRSAVLLKPYNPLNIIIPLCFQYFSYNLGDKKYECRACVSKRKEYVYQRISRAHILLQGFANIYDIIPVAARRVCATCNKNTFVTKSAATCDCCYNEIKSTKFEYRDSYKLLSSESIAVNKLDAKRI